MKRNIIQMMKAQFKQLEMNEETIKDFNIKLVDTVNELIGEGHGCTTYSGDEPEVSDDENDKSNVIALTVIVKVESNSDLVLVSEEVFGSESDEEVAAKDLNRNFIELYSK